METKVNAINLKSVDYRDNDKMLTLYSPEKGLFGAGIRGVKKPGAKLSFAAQPFCFAEYVLHESAGRQTVIGATEIESFYNLRLDLKSYYGACCIAEFLLRCTGESGDEKLFFLTADTLKKLNFGKEDPKAAVCVFFIKALDILGYGLSCFSCALCGEDKFEGEFAYFDFERGVLLCENCGQGGATKILGKTARTLKNLASGLPSDEEGLNLAIKFLNYYLEQKADVTCKCMDRLRSL